MARRLKLSIIKKKNFDFETSDSNNQSEPCAPDKENKIFLDQYGVPNGLTYRQNIYFLLSVIVVGLFLILFGIIPLTPTNEQTQVTKMEKKL
jgi:hypothetical protein